MTANPHKGQASLKAGGKTYVLAFSLNSICAIEEKTGEDISLTIGKLQENDKKAARVLLWGSLIDSVPDIQLEDAGAIIPDSGLPGLFAALAAAVQRSFPTQEGAEENPQGASLNGTGSNSKSTTSPSDTIRTASGV